MHLPSCAKTWATSKACHTSLPCFSCTSACLSSHYSAHSPDSYSDTPFDAFVAFSNVIVRPFFQNYFKRREVCRAEFVPCVRIAHFLFFKRSICCRDITLSSGFLKVELYIALQRLIAAHLMSITANLPILYRRFEALEIGVHLYLEGWFTCMFAKVLSEWCFALVCHVTPVQCLEPRLVSRVWDLYLCDGAVAA